MDRRIYGYVKFSTQNRIFNLKLVNFKKKFTLMFYFIKKK